MPDIMVIVSKAIFEKDAKRGGKLAGVGEVLPIDRYNSANKALESLRSGGKLYLVTVRPPDEKLWLVAVLEAPRFDAGAWVSAPNVVPITDISSLRSKIVFESGKGMSPDKGALGMSLQTPRALAAPDVALLDAITGGGGAAAGPSAAAAPVPSGPALSAETAALVDSLSKNPDDDVLRESTARALIDAGANQRVEETLANHSHLAAHDPSVLPCLCRKCWAAAGPRVETGGVTFLRDLVIAEKRVLFFWAPEEVQTADKVATLRTSVRESLTARLKKLAEKRRRAPRPEF